MTRKSIGFASVVFFFLPVALFAFPLLFDTWMPYDVGSVQKGIFAADVNNDGDPDLVVASYGSNAVSVLLNNGDKTFAPKVIYTTGTRPWAVIAADLDGINGPDLAVVNYGSRTVSILKNNGSGAFLPKVDYPTGNGPRSIFIANLDGDADLDLAVANDSSNTISILINNGNATFAPKVDYPAGTGPTSVFAAGLDGDADLDLAVTNDGSNNVSVFLNNGDATLAARVDYAGSNFPASVFAGDMDGDGDRDLAVSDGTPSFGAFYIYMNNGNGTFAAGVSYSLPTGRGLSSVALADVEGDGDRDLVFSGQVDGTVHVVKNNGTGTFFSPIYADYPTGIGPTALFAADLNGDTYPDLAVANGGNNNLSVHHNNGNGTFDRRQDYNGSGFSQYAVYATDLDGDLDRDLAVHNGQGFYIFKNNGDGTFGSGISYFGWGGSATSVFAADLDGVNGPDIMITDGFNNKVSVLMNNGSGTFSGRVDYTTGLSPQTVFAADLDGVNGLDLVTANYGDNKISVLKNNGNGTFAAKVDYTTGPFPYYVFAANLDTDTDLDVAVSLQFGDAVSVLLNNGSGIFAAKVDYSTGVNSDPFSVFAADLDGDNDQDLVTANSDASNNKVAVLKNNGNGTFATHVDYPTGKSPTLVVAADLDGDGDRDLAVTNNLDNTVSILRNNGSGVFAPREDYGANIGPWGLFAADLDGDGDHDLAVSEGLGTPRVSVLKNLSTVLSNTSVGRSVVVNLPGGITMSYDSIGAAGNTLVTTSSTGPPPAVGFQILPTASPLYYDFSTTAGFVGPVTICFAYNPAGLTPAQEAQMKVMHFVSAAWVDVTLSLDTASNRICAQTTSFSEFALMYPDVPTGVDDKDPHNVPREFSLGQNYPNPFNPSTEIRFALPKASEVKLEIFNILGRRVRTLMDGFVPAGAKSVTWDGKDDQGRAVSSGVYLYRLNAEEFSQTRKMMLIK